MNKSSICYPDWKLLASTWTFLEPGELTTLPSNPFLLDSYLLTILSSSQRKPVSTLPIAEDNNSVQFSHSVMSDSLQPHELQHTRPPCPLPTPRVHSDSHPSSRWCHPAISSLVIPFSSCPQSLPASEYFPVSQLFTSSGQSTGVSALASVLPKNT